jgi:hypothetical protein
MCCRKRLCMPLLQLASPELLRPIGLALHLASNAAAAVSRASFCAGASTAAVGVLERDVWSGVARDDASIDGPMMDDAPTAVKSDENDGEQSESQWPSAPCSAW